jgi:hypothetical protein
MIEDHSKNLAKDEILQPTENAALQDEAGENTQQNEAVESQNSVEEDAARREIIGNGRRFSEGINTLMNTTIGDEEVQQEYGVHTSGKAMMEGFVVRAPEAMQYWAEFSNPWKKSVMQERSLEDCQAALTTIETWEESVKNLKYFKKEDQKFIGKLNRRIDTITKVKKRVQEVQVLKQFTKGINMVSSECEKWHEVHLQLQKDMQNGIDTNVAKHIDPEEYEQFAENLADVKRTYKKLAKSETFPMSEAQKEDLELRISQATTIQRTIVLASSKQVAKQAPDIDSAYGVNVGQIESNNAKRMQQYYNLRAKHGASQQLIDDFKSLQKERESSGMMGKASRWFTKNIFKTKQSKEVEEYYVHCKKAYEAYQADKPTMQKLRKGAEHYQASFSFKRPSTGYGQTHLAA